MRILVIIALSLTFLYLIGKPILHQFRNTNSIIGHISNLLYELNYIEVETNDVIDIKKLTIKESGNIVFKNGRQKGWMQQEYGDRILNLFYNNQYLGSIHGFCTNNWYVQDYRITLTGTEDNIEVELNVDGPCGTPNKLIQLDRFNE